MPNLDPVKRPCFVSLTTNPLYDSDENKNYFKRAFRACMTSDIRATNSSQLLQECCSQIACDDPSWVDPRCRKENFTQTNFSSIGIR